MAPASGEEILHEAAVDKVKSGPATAQVTSNGGDSGSGSENGEKPVREKLKKTDLDESGNGLMDSQNYASSAENNPHESRAKAARKRSLEGKDLPDEQTTPTGIHARKRSRDARSKASEKQLPAQRSTENIAENEAEDMINSDNGSDRLAHSDGMATPLSSENDVPLTATSVSRRLEKKRSLDDLDMYTDSDRERKIAATAESRARRSSSEGPSDNSDYEKFTKELKSRKNKAVKNRQGEGSTAAATKDSSLNNDEVVPRPSRKRSRDALDEGHEKDQKPTRKRSRDTLDEEYERHQKKSSSARQSQIKTTSSESSSGTADSSRVESEVTKKTEAPNPSSLNTKAVPKQDQSQQVTDINENKKPTDTDDQTSSNGADKAVTASGSLLERVEPPSKAALDELPQTSATAFAASGFAGMVGNTSPFGAVASKAALAPSPFGSPGASSTFASPGIGPKSPAPENLPQTSSSAFAASGFASMASSASPFGTFGSKPSTGISTFGSLGNNSMQPSSSFASSTPSSLPSASPFGSTSSQSAFDTLGSAIRPSGTGFGSALGSGSKLSSFAAPVGDTNLESTQKEKPFGAPAEENESEDDSGDEDDDGKNEGPSEEAQHEDLEASSNHDAKSSQGDSSRKYKIKDGELLEL